MTMKQRGITAIETLGALAIGSLMLVGLTAMIDTSMDDLKGQQAAYYQSQLVSGAEAYIKANYDTLKNAAYAPDKVVEISIATMKDDNFLPEGFSETNAYGQRACVLVRQPVAGSGKLEALAVATGGEKIGDKDLPVAAAQSGKGGGYISTAEFEIAQGSSWSMATDWYRGKPCAAGGAAVLTGTVADGGHLVSAIFHDGPGQLSTDFLYRHEVPGQPDLNKMHTSIRFTGDAIASAGDNCGNHAAITFDSAREMLNCGVDGKWQRTASWKSPVETYAQLSAQPGTQRGDVRMVLANNRAFVFDDDYDGAGTDKWVALAVDEVGNLRVANNVYAGQDIHAVRDIHAGRDMDADRDLEVGRDVDVVRDITAGAIIHGNRIQSDWWVMANHFEPMLVMAAGDDCHIPSPAGIRYLEGSIVRDGRGIPLVCMQTTGGYEFRYVDGTRNRPW